MVLGLALLTTVAFAKDNTGKIGIGYQGDIAGNNLINSSTKYGDWSVKYGVSSNLTVQAIIGFNAIDAADALNVGARVLYDVVEQENSDFYVGAGAIYSSAGSDVSAVRISVPLGFEWSFAGLPEIGFSAEAGLAIDLNTSTGADQTDLSTVGGGLGVGIHYYF
ncbi:MAG TPA: hypothetical protein PKC21_09605 [Oligoflexia bacterium]|nr:hypothetical protein [Oligoflexia bacterium]